MTKRRRAGGYGPLDHRRRLRRIADKIEHGELLDQSEQKYLCDALQQVADGKDASSALGVKFRRGESQSAGLARRNLSLIMHIIAALTEDPSDEGEEDRFSVEKACEVVMPTARKLFGDEFSEKYDATYLQKYWSENPHLHNVLRSDVEPDTPYERLSLP